MALAQAVQLCRRLDGSAGLSRLDEQLVAQGLKPAATSKPGIRRDYDFDGVRVAVLEKPDDGFHFLEFYFELLEDKSHLSEPGAYEQHVFHYRELWNQACGQVAEILGERLFRGNWEEDDFPDSSAAPETAVWNLGGASLRVEYCDDGPEMPSWLALVVEPG